MTHALAYVDHIKIRTFRYICLTLCIATLCITERRFSDPALLVVDFYHVVCIIIIKKLEGLAELRRRFIHTSMAMP